VFAYQTAPAVTAGQAPSLVSGDRAPSLVPAGHAAARSEIGAPAIGSSATDVSSVREKEEGKTVFSSGRYMYFN
jgi:hypothetical protein